VFRARDERQTHRIASPADTGNTGLFVVGIVMSVGAAALMVRSSISFVPPIVIRVIGVVFIAVGARGRRQS
jgi:protein-S-isoprenylcysteine O-methyltransferase Ste14